MDSNKKRTIPILKESPHQSLKTEQKKEKDLVNSMMLRGENVTLSMTTSRPLILEKVKPVASSALNINCVGPG